MNRVNYRDTVLEYARQRLGTVFSNGTLDHAADITEAMLLTARDSYKVYTGTFDQEFFGRESIVNALTDFLKRDGLPTIKVLVEKGITAADLASHPWIKAAQKYPHAIEVKNAVGNYATPEAPHFSIVDNTGYRYEFDRDVRAIANFNDPEQVKTLNLVFEKAFGFGNPIYPPSHN